MYIVWPWDSFVDMAKAKRTWNCSLLKAFQSNLLLQEYFWWLHNQSEFKLSRRMIGELIFNRKRCGSISGIPSELKNSIGKFTHSFSSKKLYLEVNFVNINISDCQNSPITEPVMIRIIFLYVQEYTVNKFIVSFKNSAVIFWKFNALCI